MNQSTSEAVMRDAGWERDHPGGSAVVRTASGKPDGMNAEEWSLRQRLAAAYRIADHLGWSLVIFNHITVRIPGPEHHFLINPFGLRYDEVTASNLVKIDVDGNKVDDSPWAVNAAGFVIHAAIHREAPDAMVVFHTHTREGMAVACSRSGLTNTNFYSAMLFDHVAYHDFEGVTTRMDEQERILASMGTKPLCILRNHGLLAHGRTIEECFQRMWTLQLACETQVATEAMGGGMIEISSQATEWSTKEASLFGQEPNRGGMLFNALQRIVEEEDSSFLT
ncbi:MAG: class II aldolase/adducin family protein [Rhodospirillaceae bacterium]|nr:class II aldolase/adducin family protein [Rhodospirillaceae bacterium]